MALGQVGARTEGDVYQGLFFWKEAAGLLDPSSKVREVHLEHDAASGVDDIAVFYNDPGIDAGGWSSFADFFQIKYHVDRRDVYSSEAFISPSFLKTKFSLLKRFYEAYKKLVSNYSGFRLHFASNWRWKDDDLLASALREDDGKLPECFYTESENSDFGKIREAWRNHLSIGNTEFIAFCKTLRFQPDHFGRRNFQELVYNSLRIVGLAIPGKEQSVNPYDSLYQQFLMNRRNTFTAEQLCEICAKEYLLVSSGSIKRSLSTIGVRSYIRFAERLEEEVDEFICVSKYFSRRQPMDDRSWQRAVNDISSFLASTERRALLRANEYAILLECHGSLAVLAGYELSRNSGCAVFPIQKPSRELWKPNKCLNQNTNHGWKTKKFERDQNSKDIALVLSVSNDILADVINYLDEPESVTVSSLVCMQPIEGAGPSCIKSPEHAATLIDELVLEMRRMRLSTTVRIHLFFSAPNSLMFFLGQFREALGRVTLYEYDYDLESHCSYRPSLSFPLTNA